MKISNLLSALVTIALLLLVTNSNVNAKETSQSKKDQLKSETIKQKNNISSISGTDLGSGRIKAKKKKPKHTKK